LVWLQYRRHFSGTGHWFSSCLLQTTALPLITLRGHIPDWWSMIFSNIIMIYGQILMFRGLSLFCRQPARDWPNQILLLLFAVVQIYFSVVKPVLVVRIINISLVLALVSGQSAWLPFTRGDKPMRSVHRTAWAVAKSDRSKFTRQLFSFTKEPFCILLSMMFHKDRRQRRSLPRKSSQESEAQPLRPFSRYHWMRASADL